MDDGWKTRSGNILKGLSAQGASLDLVTFGDPEHQPDPGFREVLTRTIILPRSIDYAWKDLVLGLLAPTPFSVLNYRDADFKRAVADLCSSQSYDAVLVEDIVMAQYALPNRTAARFLDMHNVESHLLERYADAETRVLRKLYAGWTARKLKRYEVRTGSGFDAVFVCSQVDGDRLRSAGFRKPVHLVPNGIDPEFFRPSDGVEQDGSLVFVGSMDYHANISGVLHYASDILPRIREVRPGVRTYVVGKNPPPEIRALASGTLVVTGTVPDVRPFVDRASVVVVPLVVGGGTRLKILEAMAMGKAVVSTRVGCEGIEVEEGRNIELADDPQEFSDRVVGLLDDPDRAREMGKEARISVLETYTWERVTRTLAQHLAGETLPERIR
jgi:sugar transferase (PEP-CTERM/EpsH1 system associated)